MGLSLLTALVSVIRASGGQYPVHYIIALMYSLGCFYSRLPNSEHGLLGGENQASVCIFEVHFCQATVQMCSLLFQS